MEKKGRIRPEKLKGNTQAVNKGVKRSPRISENRSLQAYVSRRYSRKEDDITSSRAFN